MCQALWTLQTIGYLNLPVETDAVLGEIDIKLIIHELEKKCCFIGK